MLQPRIRPRLAIYGPRGFVCNEFMGRNEAETTRDSTKTIPKKTRERLPDLPGLVFILNIRLKKTAVGRGGQEFLIDRFGDILILVNRADDEFNLKHIALMFVPDPFNLTR